MQCIEDAIAAFTAGTDEKKQDRLINILESVRTALNNQEMFIIPVKTTHGTAEKIDLNKIQVNDIIRANENPHFKMLSVLLPEKRQPPMESP